MIDIATYEETRVLENIGEMSEKSEKYRENVGDVGEILKKCRRYR